MTCSATISECGRYRYTLERSTGIAVGLSLAWLMLNPSTADHNVDDPTIRKVVQFTRRAGYAEAVVVNLFAWRETDPSILRRTIASGMPNLLEGPGNLEAIKSVALRCHAVVCAWGAPPWAAEQAERIVEAVRGWNKNLLCLGRTKSGAPLHPLMPSYAGHPLIPFRAGDTKRVDHGGK
jgi:hypothetical protein